MSIVNKSEEITTIIYEDGSGEVYRRNDFNSPYTYQATTITRWIEWLDVLQVAEQHPEFEKLVGEVETLYKMIK